MKNCQAWGGDSGAPFFNWQNEIVGIHTKGNHDIGGLGHAGSKIDNETYDNVPIEKIKGL
jgi:V8-like Glu-specific endopeptidase